MARDWRLKKPADFTEVFKTARYKSRDSCFRVFARPNKWTCSRLGLAVSRKVSGKAVERNRIKRLIRESFRQTFAEEKVGLDIVVVAQAALAKKPNKEIFKILEKHWTRVIVQRAKV